MRETGNKISDQVMAEAIEACKGDDTACDRYVRERALRVLRMCRADTPKTATGMTFAAGALENNDDREVCESRTAFIVEIIRPYCKADTNGFIDIVADVVGDMRGKNSKIVLEIMKSATDDHHAGIWCDGLTRIQYVMRAALNRWRAFGGESPIKAAEIAHPMRLFELLTGADERMLFLLFGWEFTDLNQQITSEWLDALAEKVRGQIADLRKTADHFISRGDTIHSAKVRDWLDTIDQVPLRVVRASDCNGRA